MVIIKKNSFTLDPIIDAVFFLGRELQIEKAADTLFNCKPMLVKGVRGIGKSSFANQIANMAKGDDTLLKRYNIQLDKNEKFNFIVGIHRCTSSQNFIQLLKMLIRNLETNFYSSGLVTDAIKTKFSFDLKVFKFESEAEIRKDIAAEAITEFTEKLEEIWNLVKDRKNGILLILDELDQTNSAIDMASFFKTCHEKLHHDGYNRIVFAGVGVNEVIYKMLEQHQSIDRFFLDIDIPLMTSKEVLDLVINGFKSAGIKYDEKIPIAISYLSHGYPAVAHLVGYHIVRLDTDLYLDFGDLKKSLICVVREEKGEEFKRKLEEAGGSRYEEILRAIAMCSQEEVPNDFIGEKLDLPPHAYSSNLGKLVRDGILIKSKRGTYRFHDFLFRIYLQLEILSEQSMEEFRNNVLKIEQTDTTIDKLQKR